MIKTILIYIIQYTLIASHIVTPQGNLSMTNIVMIDDGSRQIKITHEVDGIIKTSKFASTALHGAKMTVSGYSNSAYETEEGDRLTVVSLGDDTIQTDLSSYQTSTLDRALIHEALRREGYGGKKVTIGTTLPLNQYYIGDRVNNALIEEKKANLTKGIRSMEGHALAEITEVIVFPEAIPAFIQVATEQGKDGKLIYKDGFDKEMKVCCIDLGGFTVDTAVFESLSGTIINKESREYGVVKVLNELKISIAQLISEKNIPLPIVEQAVINKSIHKHDITDLIKSASKELLDNVQKDLERMAPAISTKLYIVIGGGADLAKQLVIEHAKGISNVIVPEAPDEMISRGGYKLLKKRFATQIQSRVEELEAV